MTDRDDRGDSGFPSGGPRWLVVILGLAVALGAAGPSVAPRAAPVDPPRGTDGPLPADPTLRRADPPLRRADSPPRRAGSPADAQEICDSPSLIPLDREPRLRNPEPVASDLRRRLGKLPERPARTWYLVDQWGRSDVVEAEGRVVAWVCVDERGRVDNVRISGLGRERILENSGFAWARAMRFDPARRNGSRVAAWVKLPFLLTVE